MKRWLALDELDYETVDALFVQALAAHPPASSDKWSGRDRAVMMEWAGLIRVELEVRLNAREPLRKRA